MNVKSATVEHTMPSGSLTVLVNAEGPRGGEHLYTVHLTRKGAVSCAVRTTPSYEFYGDPKAVPEQIAKSAALAAARDRA